MGPGLVMMYGVKELTLSHVLTPETPLGLCFRQPLTTIMSSVPQNLDEAITALVVMA